MPCRQHVGTWFPPLKQTLMYGSVISTVSSQLKFTFPPQRACEWARSPRITGPHDIGTDRDGNSIPHPTSPLVALIRLLGTRRPGCHVAHLTQRGRPVTLAGPPEVARGTGAVVRSRPAEKWSRRSALSGRHRAIRGSSAWRGEGMEPRTGRPLSRTGGVCQSEGSNVSCSHAAGCPLFPLLRSSLQGWRDYYCDSEDHWRGCARYEMSLTGERVPISLLPNGARARHLEDAAGDTDRSGAGDPRQGPPQAPPPQQRPWSPESTSWSQPEPVLPPQASGPAAAASETGSWFGPASAPIPVSVHRPSPSPQLPRPEDPPSRRARRGNSSKRGVWARFTEWMGGPA